jgi:hypothetical protein
MKNIYLLRTDKPSRLYSNNGQLHLDSILQNSGGHTVDHHVYITNDEEIKDVRQHQGEWQLEKGQILNKFPNYITDLSECKLVIMTTDPDLIADGVQAIDDEFLEWFINNSSCEWVEVEKYGYMPEEPCNYKIIISQEQPKQSTVGKEFYESADEIITVYKQETLEEAAKNYINNDLDLYESLTDGHISYDIAIDLLHKLFTQGAKWMEERMYSEEEVKLLLDKVLIDHSDIVLADIPEWFENNKKK